MAPMSAVLDSVAMAWKLWKAVASGSAFQALSLHG